MSIRVIRTIAVASACVLVGWCFAPGRSSGQPSETPRLPFESRPRPASPGVGAGEFTIAIEGAKQGRFKGEGTSEGAKDKLVGVGFAYEVKTPLDGATGTPSGKRQHQPLVFTKEWGAASPQLLRAAATNEVLRSVVMEFPRMGANRTPEVFYTIKLTNASIVSLRQYEEKGRFLEDVSVIFSKIEVEDRGSKGAAEDEWNK